MSELHAAPSSLEDYRKSVFSVFKRFDLDPATIRVYGTYLWISKLGLDANVFFFIFGISVKVWNHMQPSNVFPPFAAENEDCGVPQTRKYAAFEARTKERCTSPCKQ